MNALLKNWKTTLTGFITLLLSIPTFVSAVTAWGNHQAVDWRSVLVSTALAIAGAGLLTAKDGSTHSTVDEVQASTIKQETK